MRIVKINRQPVELYKILKFEGLASSGAEAKQMISDGEVQVNSELETRKRRKMMAGDVIQIFEEQFQLALDEAGSNSSA